MSIKNTVKNSIIYGDFIGGDYAVVFSQTYKDIFEKPIFLHYLGAKIANLAFPFGVNTLAVENTTKIIAFLFDEIIVSLSDVVQSPMVYQSAFFQNLLQQKVNDRNIVSVTGISVGESLDSFFAEREEFYAKPGFYQLAAKGDAYQIYDAVSDSLRYKQFNTKKILEQAWRSTFTLFSDKGLSGVDNIYIKNLICANEQYFSPGHLEQFLCIPSRLDGYPFVWDSVKHLQLIKGEFDPLSTATIEQYLAAEWIDCYLENYHATIPNVLIGNQDCAFHLKEITNLKPVIEFLRVFQLLPLLLSLSLEDLFCLKEIAGVLCKQLVNEYCNHRFFLKNPKDTMQRIDGLVASNKSNMDKAREIIFYLYAERSTS